MYKMYVCPLAVTQGIIETSQHASSSFYNVIVNKMKFQWTYKHKPWRALDISMYKMTNDFKKTKQTSEYTQRSVLSGRVHIFPAFFQKAFLKLLKLDKYQWGITCSVNRNEQIY